MRATSITLTTTDGNGEDEEGEGEGGNGFFGRQQDKKSVRKDLPPKKKSSHGSSGDDGEASVMFTLSNASSRSYHPSHRTFLDLVDDPRRYWWAANPIRGAPPWSPLSPSELAAQKPPNIFCSGRSREAAGYIQRQPYGRSQSTERSFWPRSKIRTTLDAELDNLRAAQPAKPYPRGASQGAWDDRSFVYSTGEHDGRV